MDWHSASTDHVEVPSGRRLTGRTTLPSSKSVTHRALILALLGGRQIEIDKPLEAEDTLHTVAALEAAGWRVTPAAGGWQLSPGSPPAGTVQIDCGEAGTALRLLTGALAGLPGRWRLDGGPRLRQRPMRPLLEALRRMGAEIDCPEKDLSAPLEIIGRPLEGGRVRLDAGISSQFLSAVLLASVSAKASVEVEVVGLTSSPYVALTLEAIERFGGHVVERGEQYRIEPGLSPPPRLVVDGDYSSAAYWAAGAALSRGSVELVGLDTDSRQGDRGFLDLLRRMGAAVDWDRDRLTVGSGARLQAIDADLSGMPDQVPTLAAIAPFAQGTTRIRNVEHLRWKESNRLAAMRQELGKLGVPIRERQDGLEIDGIWSRSAPPDDRVEVDTWNDHRIAMSLAITSLRRPGVVIRQPGVVAKSYPEFWSTMARLLEA